MIIPICPTPVDETWSEDRGDFVRGTTVLFFATFEKGGKSQSMRKRTVYLDDDPNLCAELQVIWLSCQKFHSLGLQFTCVAKACGPTYKGMKCIGISIYGTAADKDIFIEIEIS